MAVVRARSAPPYGLIAFVALWVISTVLAVLFYLKWTKSTEDLDQSNKRLAAVAKSSEFTSIVPNLTQGNTDRTQSALGIAQQRLDGLTALVAGGNKPYKDAIDQATGALAAAGHDKESLTAAVLALASERDTARKSLDEAKSQLAGISSQAGMVTKQSEERAAGLAKDVEDLRTQLAKTNEDLAKASAARDQAVAAGEQNVTSLIEKHDAEIRQKVLEVQELQGQIVKLTSQVNELKTHLKPKETTVATGEADGEILRASAASGEAWVRVDGEKITPGLTFGVYDSRTGVRYGTDAEAQGKGSVEVLIPGAAGSPTLCRITRTTKGQTIQPGDLISNIVFNNNKARKYHFIICGDFDLDGDGAYTADERDRLAALVRNSGGVVDDSVTPQTDYVVMGERPSAPLLPTVVSDMSATAPATAPAEPVPGSIADQRRKEQVKWDGLKTEAVQLSIPILNQNRFLAMIGYYSTTIVRH